MHKIIILAVLLITGCATGAYIPGDINSEDKLAYAILNTDSDTDHKLLRGFDEVITITRIDDKSLFSWLQPYPESAYLAPGPHTVGVQFTYLGTIANGCLELDAIAGKSYIVRKRAFRYSVQFWIENESTGEIVGNICGYEKGPPESNSTNREEI